MSNTRALIRVRSALNGLVLSREHSPIVQLKGAALIWLIRVEIRVLCGVAGMNGICGCQGTVGDYKDASGDMNACMHANHGVSLVVLMMFVKTSEFISRDMIHACVVRYNDTD